MKITHVTPAFYPAHIYGGPIEAVFCLCKSLIQAECEVRVLTTDADGPDKVLDIKKGEEVEISPGLHVNYCRRLNRHAASPALLHLLPRYIRWADVVHLTAAYSFPTIPTLLACSVFGKPVIWSPRGALQRWEGSTRIWAKTMWQWVCRCMAPQELLLHFTSEQEARDSLERFPGVASAVIPNGVDIPELVTHVPEKGKLRLLYLGRLHAIKGIENLLLACHKLNSTDITWSLTIGGSGNSRYTEVLKGRIADYGMTRQVLMVGEVTRERKQQLFEKTDILVVPSFSESFGMVVAEALAHGVPVIASRGTPWKRVEEIGGGLWVQNDQEILAKAIVQMSQMPLREMGQRGREWMKREFSWPFVAGRMVQLYADFVVNSR